jgi:hypothetical protein
MVTAIATVLPVAWWFIQVVPVAVITLPAVEHQLLLLVLAQLNMPMLQLAAVVVAVAPVVAPLVAYYRRPAYRRLVVIPTPHKMVVPQQRIHRAVAVVAVDTEAVLSKRLATVFKAVAVAAVWESRALLLALVAMAATALCTLWSTFDEQICCYQ